MTGRDSPTLCRTSASPVDGSTIVLPNLTGGTLYRVQFQVTGCFCLRTYIGGVPITAHVKRYTTSAVSPICGWDTFKLVTTYGGTTRWYVLNNGVTSVPDGNVSVDYKFNIPVTGGTVVRLEQDNIDHLQYFEDGVSKVISPSSWCQVRFAAATLVTGSNTRAKGGGVRNFVFTGFGVDVYATSAPEDK